MTRQRVIVLAVMTMWVIIKAQTDRGQTAGFRVTDVD